MIGRTVNASTMLEPVIRFERLGVVLNPDGCEREIEGDAAKSRATQRFRYRAFMSHFRTRLRSVCVPKFAFWCSSRLASPRNPSIWRGVARFMHGVAGKYGDKVFLGEH
jgi:hypothetical protein